METILKDDRDVAEWARKFKTERTQKKTYVLYFTSSTCGGCIEYEPHWQQFVKASSKEMKHVAVVVVKDYALYPLAEKLHFHLRYTPTILFMFPIERQQGQLLYKWKVIQERAVPDLLRKLRETRQNNKDNNKTDTKTEKEDITTALVYSYHSAHVKDPANYANLTALTVLKENGYAIRITKTTDWTKHMTLTVNGETTYHGHAASTMLGSLVRSLCL